MGVFCVLVHIDLLEEEVALGVENLEGVCNGVDIDACLALPPTSTADCGGDEDGGDFQGADFFKFFTVLEGCDCGALGD